MTKTGLILNGKGLTSTCILSDNHGNMPFAAGLLPTIPSIFVNQPPSVCTISGVNYLEVQNGHTLNLTQDNVPFEDIVATQGTITIHNNYTGSVKAAIIVGHNSTVILTGSDLPISQAKVSKDANFNFNHNPIAYQINTPNNKVK